MEGRQASRKFSAQIQAYARVRWPELARVDLYEIGKRLRKEIASVFGVKRSQETLRPLMGGLKRGGRGDGGAGGVISDRVGHAPRHGQRARCEGLWGGSSDLYQRVLACG